VKCLKSKKLLIEYADGRLQDELREEFESHLRNCHRCRDELKELETSLQLVIETVDEDIPTPSADFIPELKRRIEKLDSKADTLFPKRFSIKDVKIYPFGFAQDRLESRINSVALALTYLRSGIRSFVWSQFRKLTAQPRIWAIVAIAFLLIISSILILPRFDKSDRLELSPVELQKIANLPEGQMLIEMLPVSRPYIDALLEAQEEKKAQEKIISTIDNVKPQLWERVIKLLEVSADALENSTKFEEEQNLSWDDEII